MSALYTGVESTTKVYILTNSLITQIHSKVEKPIMTLLQKQDTSPFFPPLLSARNQARLDYTNCMVGFIIFLTIQNCGERAYSGQYSGM